MTHHEHDACVPVETHLTEADAEMMVALGFATREHDGLHITEKGDRWLRSWIAAGRVRMEIDWEHGSDDDA